VSKKYPKLCRLVAMIWELIFSIVKLAAWKVKD
jgi:hypothetical protein